MYMSVHTEQFARGPWQDNYGRGLVEEYSGNFNALSMHIDIIYGLFYAFWHEDWTMFNQWRFLSKDIY